MLDRERFAQYTCDPAAFQADLVIPSAHGPRRFGDVMAEFQRERFASLNSALLAIARGQRPIIGRQFWEATKGGSKDTDLAVCVLWLLAVTRRSLLIQVGAADEDQADELRRAAKDILNLNPQLAARIEIQSWRLLCREKDAACEIVAADIGGSHGARPDVLIINELTHITKQEFAENLMDNAAKVPHGLVIIATNAGMLDTWQWRWREIARQSAESDQPRWVYHRLAEPAPYLDRAVINEGARRNSVSRQNRLFWGIWSHGDGDALDKADIDASVKHELGTIRCWENGTGLIGGLDLGVRRDHSAICILAMHAPTQRIQLAYVHSWAPGPNGQIDLIDVQSTALGVARAYGCGYVYDPHQAELMAQQLRLEDVPMEPMPFVGKNLDLMANTLLQVFRNRQIDLYPDAELIRDLGRLSIVERGFGYKIEAPRDKKAGHCDKAFALSVCLPAAMEAMANEGGGYTESAVVAELMQQRQDFERMMRNRLSYY